MPGDYPGDVRDVQRIDQVYARKLLAMGRVTLIGIVGNQLAIVSHEERFPDRRVAVVSNWRPADSNVALTRTMVRTPFISCHIMPKDTMKYVQRTST
jgi:hypothetical protein